MRSALLLPLLLLCACSETTPETTSTPTVPTEATTPAIDTTHAVVLTSLAGKGVRFNGVYVYRDKSILYFMRFFERGNVALVAGPEPANTNMSIRNLLTEDVQSGDNNVHNCPVEQRGDSLMFRTMSYKGAIRYAGVVRGDTARFLKISDINGKRALLDYVFEPDMPFE